MLSQFAGVIIDIGFSPDIAINNSAGRAKFTFRLVYPALPLPVLFYKSTRLSPLLAGSQTIIKTVHSLPIVIKPGVGRMGAQ